LDDSPNVRAALRQAAERLRQAGVEDERLVAELLLGHVLRLDRARLFSQPQRPLKVEEARLFAALVARAVEHEPPAYILGRREFYGLEMLVDRRVLVPRPETEQLVEEALAWARSFRQRTGDWPLLVDVGTGSGAIAVSLAVHLPEARVYATDISAEALAVAAENARRHSVQKRLLLLEGDLLSAPARTRRPDRRQPPLRQRSGAARPAPNVARHEPRLALAGGPDGLDVYRRLLAQVPTRLSPSGALLLEIGASQGESARELAATLPGSRADVLPDLAGLPRLLRVQTAPAGHP
jgi:release factor glutamine methyltransferase